MASPGNTNSISIDQINQEQNSDTNITPLRCKAVGCDCAHFAIKDDTSWKCIECNHDKKEHGIRLKSKTGCSDSSCNCELFKPCIDRSGCSTCKHSDNVHVRFIWEEKSAPAGTIWFYNRDDPYFFLTNFIEGYEIVAALPDSICEGGDCGGFPNSSNNNNNNNVTIQRHREKLWPTSEHLFQAMKFKDTNPIVAERIRLYCRSPREALNMARRHQEYVDPKWQEKNVDAMFWVVKQKFFQHDALAKQLLKTGNLKLVEHTDTDRFWGDGGDGNGQNKLGIVLMRVRELLRQRYQAREKNHTKSDRLPPQLPPLQPQLPLLPQQFLQPIISIDNDQCYSIEYNTIYNHPHHPYNHHHG
ncbi:10307_t:CDS:2 [Ambispora gerdemannii]|uniref:10307_t:CDS:1 n=1 Tax=Ambispora gerdemannii TaxID=144530 RepID=A0A9N8VCW7_9GLOM|nr:10307_t:CDS:2 [Ambispora gerdemannii]